MKLFNKPRFKDCCDHGKKDFAGHYRLNKRYVDVYFYDGKLGAHYCLRYSNEPSDYSSLPVSSLFQPCSYGDNFTKEQVIEASNEDFELIQIFFKHRNIKF